MTADLREPIDVERLLEWTYRAQKAHLTDRGVELLAARSGAGASNAAIIAAHMALGTKVDASRGPAWLGAEAALAIHPDALVVHEAVRSLDRPTAGDILLRAKTGTRPEAGLDGLGRPKEPRLAARRDAGGRPLELVEYSRSRNRLYSWCPLVVQNSPDEIAWERAQWRRWHDGLVTLARLLNGKEYQLTRWVVTGPAVAAEPWALAAPGVTATTTGGGSPLPFTKRA